MNALLVAVLALIALAFAASGPSVRDLCNGECPLTAEAVSMSSLFRHFFTFFLSSFQDRVHLTSNAAVTPYPPKKGSPATLNVRGNLAGTAVSSGVITTNTYYKVANPIIAPARAHIFSVVRAV